MAVIVDSILSGDMGYNLDTLTYWVREQLERTYRTLECPHCLRRELRALVREFAGNKIYSQRGDLVSRDDLTEVERNAVGKHIEHIQIGLENSLEALIALGYKVQRETEKTEKSA